MAGQQHVGAELGESLGGPDPRALHRSDLGGVVVGRERHPVRVVDHQPGRAAETVVRLVRGPVSGSRHHHDHGILPASEIPI